LGAPAVWLVVGLALLLYAMLTGLAAASVAAAWWRSLQRDIG
jgi:hypothetical protein